MMNTERLLKNIKRIAYEPTWAERRVFADVILQQITAIAVVKEYPMAVMIRKNAPGIILGYSPEMLADLTDGELCTMLCHETQHLRSNDLNVQGTYKAERDWYNGWNGSMLHNVARDCQINDLIVGKLRMPYVEGGMYGTEALGHATDAMETEAVMREVAQKLPPPPENDPQPMDLQVQELEAADAAGKEEQEVSVSGGKEAAKYATQKVSTVSRSPEQARFDRFLAEMLDTRKHTESWFRVPKRLMGVRQFAEREIVIPNKTPLPRLTALLAIDVSGSMDEGGVQRLCSLIKNAPANYDLTVVCFDDDLAVWENFRTNNEMPRRGGGTDFGLVEAHAKKMVRYPDAILVLTDGGGDIPEVKKPKNWTWVLYQADVQGFAANAKMRSVDLEQVIKRG